MLSDTKVRNAKAKDKPYKLTDGGGLHLYVTKTGSRLWRFRYEYGGREKLLSLGEYDSVGLAKARELRDAAKVHLQNGRDPGQEKKLRKLAGVAEGESFEEIARAWHALRKAGWTEEHAQNVIESLEHDVFPVIGAARLTDIRPPAVLAVLRQIEARGAIETAHRVRQRMSKVFVFAIASGIASDDPAAIVGGAMAEKKKGRYPALLDMADVQEMIRKAILIPALPMTKLALLFTALTVPRSSEMRGAVWSEFHDLEGSAPVWVVPAARMKMRREHVVPLSRQAVAVLLEARKASGTAGLVFPMSRNQKQVMCENAVGYLLHRAGYHGLHVPHGFRSTFSTNMNERFVADRHIIDMMLAHKPPNEIEAAYNRAEHRDRRRELAQIWADWLMEGAFPIEDVWLGRPKVPRVKYRAS